MITRFYLLRLSTNVKHPKFGCHVTSLCQGLRRSAGSGGEDPENQVGRNACSCRTRRVRLSKSPWITTELKKRMHERDILKIKAIRSKDIYDWAAFKKACNSVNNEIKLAKKAYYMKAFHENESNVKKNLGYYKRTNLKKIK